MTCAALCFTCKAAGIAKCPFGAGVVLPLAPAPTVSTKRPRLLWIPPGATPEQAQDIIDRFYGRTA
jgi:hypothetical protein